MAGSLALADLPDPPPSDRQGRDGVRRLQDAGCHRRLARVETVAVGGLGSGGSSTGVCGHPHSVREIGTAWARALRVLSITWSLARTSLGCNPLPNHLFFAFSIHLTVDNHTGTTPLSVVRVPDTVAFVCSERIGATKLEYLGEHLSGTSYRIPYFSGTVLAEFSSRTARGLAVHLMGPLTCRVDVEQPRSRICASHPLAS